MRRILLATGIALAIAAPARDATAGLESLVPELAAHPYRIAPGPQPFRHRLAVTPAYGQLGSDRMFALRIEYSPSTWLAYEASLAHVAGGSAHSALHTFSAIVRYPLPGRFQPSLNAGYGMMMVFPGRALNADPVTKNALTVGGGLALLIRNDLALRADMRLVSVFGRQGGHDGTVVYDYLQETIGLSFSRTIAP